MSNTVQPLFSGDLSPRLLSAVQRFDDEIYNAIQKAYDDNIPQGLLVSVLHSYTQQQTLAMLDIE